MDQKLRHLDKLWGTLRWMDEKLRVSEKSVQKNILTKIATDGVRIEEKLCASIMKGLARRNREMHAMLADVDEENHDVVCVDGTTGKELPWHAVRKSS